MILVKSHKNYKMQLQSDFIDELPTVFDILKDNPEAIVDDTAIERLLSWLEDLCKQKNEKFIRSCSEFFGSEEIWNHPLALSFVLRFCGFFGYANDSYHEKLYDVIKSVLSRVTHHKLFTEPSVKYAYYNCLASLSNEEHWCKELFVHLNTMMEAFRNARLYVKKAAVNFFTHYLQTALVTNQPVLIKTIENLMHSNSSPELGGILDSITRLCELSISAGLEWLQNTNVVYHVVEQIKDRNSKELLGCLISLFDVLTCSDANVEWDKIIQIPEGTIHSYLLQFVSFVNKSQTGSVPNLCESLLQKRKNSHFPCDWNSTVLTIMLKKVIYNNKLLSKLNDNVEERLPHQTWKVSLITTIIVMCKIGKKMKHDIDCTQLVDVWSCFCMDVLVVSLNYNVSCVVDEYLISVINNKKISRLCFQYLNTMNLEDLSIEVKKKFVSCLWTCLFSHSDNSHMICSTLELLANFINVDLLNFTVICEHQDNNVEQARTIVANVLNMKLCDISWEVKDSVISVLIEIVDACEKDHEANICLIFLEQDAFWCSVIDLLDDDESYVRSKAVKFIGKIFLCDAVWKVFSIKKGYDKEKLWRRLESIFTNEARQDDMFTRRSVLDVITMLVESETLNDVFFKSSSIDERDSISEGNQNIQKLLFSILQNSNDDFDWEVRKLYICVWSRITSMSSCDKEKWRSFIDLIVEHRFAYSICLAVSDCEYEVRYAALQCLQAMREKSFTTNNQGEVDKQGEIDNRGINFSISTLTDFESYTSSHKNLRSQDFEKILLQTNFFSLINQLEVIDVSVKSDPVSFIQDIISSAKRSEENLLDCY